MSKSQVPVFMGLELEYDGVDFDFAERKLHSPEVLAKLNGLKVRMYYGSDYDYRLNCWNICEDSSAENYGCGSELRSPKCTSFADFDILRSLLPVIEGMSLLNNKCGMHVHLSVDKGYKIDYEKMLAKMKPYKDHAHRSRREYCEWGIGHKDEYQNEWDSDKYKALYIISDQHVEVRIFNSTFDFKEVMKRVRFCVKILRESLIKETGQKKVKAKVKRKRELAYA